MKKTIKQLGDEQLADDIIDALFVNGSGEEAQRLVLTVDTPMRRDLGGWGRLPARDAILRVLGRRP